MHHCNVAPCEASLVIPLRPSIHQNPGCKTLSSHDSGSQTNTSDAVMSETISGNTFLSFFLRPCVHPYKADQYCAVRSEQEKGRATRVSTSYSDTWSDCYAVLPASI